ncbi:hypothetical protein ONE63_009043 [Megalurothrips usitatus]|uniref:Ig-like domain-containing protein n=1 Tax=Megalurothrips usitatus TaxID=439358 RepID=A0AAV7XN45_9NEOP|nr:hypothetical protein ONE63_009043 [Megalurothrips usitatus]
MCFGTAKPRHKEPCGSEKCPTWDSGEWSECSASCGMGIQTRPLTCVDSYGSSLDDTACDPLRQPPLTRTCLAPAPCPAPQQTYNSLVPSGSDEDDADDTFDPDADSESEYTDPLMRPYPPPMPAVAERLVGSSGAGSAFVPGPWGPCSASCGEGAQHREVHCRVYLEGTKARARIDDRECPGPKPAERQSCSGPPCVSTTSRRFVVGEWGPCSSTCGEGVQRREVHCRLFLELSRATTTLKAHQCPDPKPPDSRPCTVALCPMANTLEYRQDPPMADTAESPRVGGRKGTFSWRDQGFGECSKSCLGGVQEAIIQCIREDDDKVVTPHLCSQEPKPEQRTRTCNDQPCPPRWNVTEFSQCSDVCGMGIKSREVVCIHEVTNAIVHRVAPSRCPAPPPPDRSYCNVLDCPAAWNASEWSKCSKHCNGGVKTRVVSCTQRMAQNHVVVRPASQCPAEGRPSERRPCNPKPCSPEDNRPHIDANPDAYNYEAKPNQRQAAVKIGGTATIFLGTRLKIRCPVKRFNRGGGDDDDDDDENDDGKFVLTFERGPGRAWDGAPWGSGGLGPPAGRRRRWLFGSSSLTTEPPTTPWNVSGEFDGQDLDGDRNQHPPRVGSRSKIAWHKDGKPLHSSKKYHISNKAVLRVNDATVQDAGRYTCHAGHSSADLTVMVKSRPGEFISSEEIAGGQQTQQHPRHRGPGDSGLVFPVAGGGDISHEVSPTGTSRYNMKRKTAPPPEKPYYPSSERNNPTIPTDPANLGQTHRRLPPQREQREHGLPVPAPRRRRRRLRQRPGVHPGPHGVLRQPPLRAAVPRTGALRAGGGSLLLRQAGDGGEAVDAAAAALHAGPPAAGRRGRRGPRGQPRRRPRGHHGGVPRRPRRAARQRVGRRRRAPLRVGHHAVVGLLRDVRRQRVPAARRAVHGAARGQRHP